MIENNRLSILITLFIILYYLLAGSMWTFLRATGIPLRYVSLCEVILGPVRKRDRAFPGVNHGFGVQSHSSFF